MLCTGDRFAEDVVEVKTDGGEPLTSVRVPPYNFRNTRYTAQRAGALPEEGGCAPSVPTRRLRRRLGRHPGRLIAATSCIFVGPGCSARFCSDRSASVTYLLKRGLRQSRPS